MNHLQMLPYSLAKFNQLKIDQLANRVIVFVIPGRVKSGVQPNEIRFPWNGHVVDIYATCRVPGSTDTVLRVQKISIEDFKGISSTPVGWVDVALPITLQANKKFQESDLSFTNTEVNKNDHFRVVVEQLGTDVEDITIEVTVKTDFFR
jgi:hypothetical protein